MWGRADKGSRWRKRPARRLRHRDLSALKIPLLASCLLSTLVACDERPRAQRASTTTKLVISGDTSSWIMPCGCTSNQSGGLLRRATYLKSLTAQRPVICADAGGAVSGTSEYQRVKFEAILRGE